MARIMDALRKEAPAGRGVCQLNQTEIKEITQARSEGYSWEQIHKVVGKYNSPQAMSSAYYREIGESPNGSAK